MSISYLVYALIVLIPFQLYSNFYREMSISVAQILSIILTAMLILKDSSGFKEKMRQAGYLILSVAMFVVVMLLSILVSDTQGHSIKFSIKWISFISLFLVGYLFIRDISEIRKALLFFMIAAAGAALIGYYEYFFIGPDRLVDFLSHSRIFPRFMEPDTLKDKLAAGTFNWICYGPQGTFIRIFGTFECSIAFSAFLGLIIPFGATIVTGFKKFRFMLIAGMGIVIMGMILTFSRSAYLGFLAVVALNIAYFTLVEKRKILTLATILTLVFGMMFLIKPVRNGIQTRFDGSIEHQFDRKELWRNGFAVFAARPLLGVGVANYVSGLRHFAASRYLPLPAHNEYLQIAAEMGFAGLTCYLAIIFFGIRYSVHILRMARGRDTKLLALGFLGMWIWYCIQSLFNSGLFAEKFSMMFWYMIGMNAALYRIFRDSPNAPQGTHPDVR